MKTLREKIHTLPKAERHNHLHLGGNIELFKARYGNNTPYIPARYKGYEGMMDFIRNHLNKILLNTDDVIFFMEAGLESCIDDNIIYLEASVDIGLVRFFDGSIERFIDTMKTIKNKYKSRLIFRPEIGIKKDENLPEVFHDILKCIRSGVFNGIDIYGHERNQNLNGFVKIFDFAKQENLKTKVHIGEFSESKTIEEAIMLLCPDEIQHGIRAADSIRTMDIILENDIRMNICPQSNIALGASNHILEHPVRKLFDHGINITINTDDLLLFDTSLTEQYAQLIENDIFSYEEIVLLIEKGLNQDGHLLLPYNDESNDLSKLI